MSARNGVKHCHGTVEAQPCMAVILGTLLTAAVVAVILEKIITAFSSFM